MVIWCNVYNTVVKNSCDISPNCTTCVESEDYCSNGKYNCESCNNKKGQFDCRGQKI